MSEYIERPEHEEFAKRIEAECKRQSKRIEVVEQDVRDLRELTESVGKIAASTELIAKEQEKQSVRLEALEKVPAKRWNTLITGILSAAAGAVGTGIVAAIVSFMK